MSRTGTVSTAGNELTEYITSNIESSSDLNDHYADLADIIRIAMGRIKTGVYNRGNGRNARLVRPSEERLNLTIIGPTKLWKYKALTINGKIFGPTKVGMVEPAPPALYNDQVMQ